MHSRNEIWDYMRIAHVLRLVGTGSKLPSSPWSTAQIPREQMNNDAASFQLIRWQDSTSHFLHIKAKFPKAVTLFHCIYLQENNQLFKEKMMDHGDWFVLWWHSSRKIDLFLLGRKKLVGFVSQCWGRWVPVVLLMWRWTWPCKCDGWIKWTWDPPQRSPIPSATDSSMTIGRHPSKSHAISLIEI